MSTYIAVAVQDPVKPLRIEYKAAINFLPEHLTEQQAQKVNQCGLHRVPKKDGHALL